MSGNEVELKLGLQPEDMERLRRQRAWRAHLQQRPTVARLRSVYFDTAEFDLARAGITLRVRTIGRRHLQTVKHAGSRVAGLFTRREWETGIPSPAPDRLLMRSTGLPPLQNDDILGRLAPVFTTLVHRTVYRLADDDWRVEMAFDRGEVEAGDQSEPICELELELTEGTPATLFSLARDIVAIVPARLLTLSKSDRGYELARGTAPLPVKSTPVDLKPEADIEYAFRAIARNCLHHLLANERSLLATGDGEAVHQMRVALRRLRSAMKIFRSAVGGPELDHIKTGIAWLLGILGPARDAEVFVAEIIDPVVDAHADNPALAALRRHWLHTRRTDLEAATAAVADRRFTDLLLTLGAWVEAGDWRSTGDRAVLGAPLLPFATAQLAKRDRKLRSAAGRGIEELPAAELHQLRILGKQLRYAAEFFAPLFAGKDMRTFVATVSALQDALGQLNDIAVAGPRLANGMHDGDIGWAAGMVLGWHAARRPALLDEAGRAWHRYRKVERPWRP
ncbi:MAG: CHAD domain-containing protein [Solirubrobacterales bacterium]